MNNTKTRSRRKFTAEFKAKVAMEALQEKLTLTELSKKYPSEPDHKMEEPATRTRFKCL